MVFGNTKRIVVIKDIPSNIIEEAIFILKSEPGSKAEGKNDKNKGTTVFYNKFGKDYLIKEAESVINNYIAENKSIAGAASGVHLSLGGGKKKLTANLTINIALICSVALLIFVVSRFF